MIDLKKTPIKNIVAIEGPLVTLECVCGRNFVVKDGTINNTRCEVCLEFSEKITPITKQETIELGLYMYDNVLTEYEHKLNRV